ncbi:MAG: glycoside hydrolase family 13 protein [Anaerolineaceae bacterium]
MSAELNHTPEWVKNAVFYQIFPDRFAWSSRVEKPGNFEPWETLPTVDGFKGGDLVGVTEKLDYLEDLGINAIYFNPIFQSASNHRYHTHDYYQVDPLLGGNKAFKELLDEAHKRSIRIILDGVFNHASRGFFQFNNILEVGAKSPYLDWFFVHGFPLHAYDGDPNYECWWCLPGLPKFNTNNPQVRKYLFDVARYWVDQGIDGWRLDVPFEINDDGFWREFRSVVKTANPEAYIVGEIPSEAQRWLSGDMFDGVMNYQLTHACLSFFGDSKIDRPLAEGMMGLEIPEPLDAAQFSQRTQELLTIYPHEFALAQLNLLDSHDMPRFLSLVQNDTQRLYLAYLFIMTYPGAPCIYYGDEIGLTGGKDPLCRKAFPWDESDWNTKLRDRIKELVYLRNAIPALRTGSYKILLTQGGLLAYLRQDENDSVIVVINLDDYLQKFDLNLLGSLPEGTVLQDQIGDLQIIVENGKLNMLSVPQMSALILA